MGRPGDQDSLSLLVSTLSAWTRPSSALRFLADLESVFFLLTVATSDAFHSN